MPNVIPGSATDGTLLQENFMGNSAVADALMGTLRFEITALTTADTLSFLASPNGVLRMTGAGAADNTGSVLNTHPDGIVLVGGNQEFVVKLRYPAITGNVLAANNFRVGFTDSVAITEPAVGVWVDSNAGVIEFDVASTNGDINVAAAGPVGTTLTSGTTMVLGTWHEFRFIMDGTNTNGGPDRVRFFVDGRLHGTINNVLLGSTETMELTLVHWQDSGGAASLELDVDYIEAWIPRTTDAV